MNENPYQAPETTGPSVAAPVKHISHYPLLIMFFIAVPLEGFSSYSIANAYGMFDDGPAAKIFWATPVVALLLSAFLALRGTAAASLQQSLPKLMGITMLSLLVTLGGYVCFATTCGCTNLVVEIKSFRPDGAEAGRISFGIVCTIAMVFSCLVTTSALQTLAKRTNTVNEDDWV